MRDFRLLRPDEIECRVSEIAKKGNGLWLLLYKTARVDAALLDETYGAANWQNDYRVLDGKMYCGIGVKHDGEWVWKWNVGTESNTEAEKGEASDAMKRAGFVLGLGTELYSSPRIWVPSDKCEIKDVNGKLKCYDSFSVKEVGYDKNENIESLVIVNDKTGEVCFAFRKGQAPAAKETPMLRCADCNDIIKPYVSPVDGKTIPARKQYEGTINAFGRPLCPLCVERVKQEGNVVKR